MSEYHNGEWVDRSPDPRTFVQMDTIVTTPVLHASTAPSEIAARQRKLVARLRHLSAEEISLRVYLPMSVVRKRLEELNS